MRNFSQKVREELKFYVYCLVDPRDQKIFYVGKGCGDRVFAHACNALEDGCVNTDKIEKIREIIESGRKVKHYIIRHKLTEEDALTVESVLIDFLTYEDFNTDSLLTNIVAGHRQWDEGIKTVDEIEQLYECESLQLQKGHKLLMVNLNRSYIQKRVDGLKVRPDLYEITRGNWHVSKANADKVNYVLGVYKGIVRCVIKPTAKWKEVNDPQSKSRRYRIEGVTNDQIGNALYLNKDVTAYPFPSRGAVRYIR